MGLSFKIMKPVDVSYLDNLFLLPSGLLKPFSAKDIKDVDPDHLMPWCVKNAVYQLPTTELIDWLKEQIGDKKAIEIGAGKSGIGRSLGIPATDSWIQTNPKLMAYYKLLNQPVVVPPEYVEKLDAASAIKKYKPEVVIGCFITQKYQPGDEDGNVYGPDETEIINQCTYIHVGNEKIHGKKRILALPHAEYRFPWIRSRAIDNNLNLIWVWEQKG